MYKKFLEDNVPSVKQIFDGYLPSRMERKSTKTVTFESVVCPDKYVKYRRKILKIIGSRLELSQVLQNSDGKERRLAELLTEVSDEYDLILIDCPPTESVLTQAAYHASRYLVVPVKTEYLPTIGLPLLANSLSNFQNFNKDHHIEIAGIVFNNASTPPSQKETTPEVRQSIKEVSAIAKLNNWPVFQTQIWQSKYFPTNARYALAITEVDDKRTKAPENFKLFVTEFEDKVGLHKKTD